MVRTTEVSKGGVVPATVALLGLTWFAGAIATLHLLQPAVHPVHHPTSQYAAQQWGWVMDTAFVSMSIAAVSLVIALRRTLGSRVSPVGLGGLTWFGVAVWIALAFPLDPIGAETTTHGIIHRINGATSFLALTVGVVLVSRSLRSIESWEGLGRRAKAMGYGMVVLYIATVVTNVAKLGIAGLVQRLDLIILVSWVTMIAMRLRRGGGESGSR